MDKRSEQAVHQRRHRGRKLAYGNMGNITVIREMQIITTRPQYTSIRMANIKTSD